MNGIFDESSHLRVANNTVYIGVLAHRSITNAEKLPQYFLYVVNFARTVVHQGPNELKESVFL